MSNAKPATPAIRSHRDLVVWQKAMALAANVYVLGRSLPQEERYGLTQQMQRAAVSVAANIAEGRGRLGEGEYVHALSVARGSLMELACLVEIAVAVGYVKQDSIRPVLGSVDEIGRMLWAIIQKLNQRRLRTRASLPPA